MSIQGPVNSNNNIVKKLRHVLGGDWFKLIRMTNCCFFVDVGKLPKHYMGEKK